MNRKGIIGKVVKIAEPIADELGYELVDLEYERDKSAYFLRIYIDKTGGVTLDDCQQMSQVLGDALDKEDPISTPYYLEVSSPGLDRPLKNDRDLERNLGKEVEIRLYKPLDNHKQIFGILDRYDEEEIVLRLDNEKFINIKKELIALIKLVIKF
ncbi:MAG: ribosome maturation factor RimP [Tissierellaceae bacterium]